MIDYEIELKFLEEDFFSEKEESPKIELKQCAQNCVNSNTSCDEKECKHWINFGDDNNCDLVSIEKYGPLTLRQVGERMGVSYVRIKQIEDVAIKKIRKTVSLERLTD